MRKLASIQQIKDVLVHPNADLLELAKINGWQCVIKKGEFKPGDLGVYFEIDSFLPASDTRYEFLEKNFQNFNDTRGARIRTIKLRKELSQGLILPLHAFPELEGREIDDDVTEELGVIKYEKPVPIHAEAKGNFPSFIEKTEQERVQNLRHIDVDVEWEVTEKLDGSSLTIYRFEEDFGVCSRNLDLEETETNPMWEIAKRLRLKERLNLYGKNIALQGEILGPKIQSNRYQFDQYEYFVFDIYDIDKKRKMLPSERIHTLKELNLLELDGELDEIKSTPVISHEILSTDENWIDELLKKADGYSNLNPNTIREGFVYKHPTKVQSFKVISNKFLLKYDE